MSSTTRTPGRRRSRFAGVVGLVASLSMVFGGLTALALAPTASAAVAASGNDHTAKVNLTAQICHRDGQSGNWNYLTPNFNAVVKQTLKGNDIPGGHANANHQDGADIIAPIIYDGYTYFPGQNWTAENQAFMARGCSQGTLYTVTKTVDEEYCLDGKTIEVEGTGTATWGSSKDAEFTTQSAAKKAAEDRAKANLLTKVPTGATEGECEDSHVKTVTATAGPETYCVDGETLTYTGEGSATWGEHGQYETKAEAEAAAQAAANRDLARQIPEGAVAGECQEATLFTVTRSAGPEAYCSNGETIQVSGEGSATWGTSKLAEFATEGAAITAAQARATTNLESNVPEGATKGECPALTLFTVTRSAGPQAYCYSGETIQVSGEGQATWGTSALAEFPTEGQAISAAQARATSNLESKVPQGASPGACKDATLFTVTRSAGPAAYCVDGQTVQVSGEGSATWGTSPLAEFASEGAAITAAQARANTNLGSNVPEGAVAGECPALTLFTVTRSAGPDAYCDNGETVQVSGEGQATWGTSPLAEFATEGPAIAAAQARATSNLESNVPEGAVAGECPALTITTVTVDAGPVTYCANGENVPVSGRGSATWGTSPNAEFKTEGEALTAAQQRADANVAANAPEGAVLGTCSQTPPPTPLCADGVTPIADGCPVPQQSFTMQASTRGSVDFCVNGSQNVVVEFAGSGEGTSGISTDDALYIANQKANAAAAADLAAKTPANSSRGACGTSANSVTTVNVPQAGTVPLVDKPVKPIKPTKPVSKPSKGTVPSNVNAGVGGSIPTTATIPTAVNAGGGSSAPQGAPMWAYVLLLAGAAGAIVAGARLAGGRRG